MPSRIRTIRVDDALWAAVKAAAAANGTTVSEIVRGSLQRYARRYGRDDKAA